MKTTRVLLLGIMLLTLLLVSGTMISAANLLANAGFNQTMMSAGSGGSEVTDHSWLVYYPTTFSSAYPESWKASYPQYGPYAVWEGTNAVWIVGKVSLSQKVYVSPNVYYTASAWVKPQLSFGYDTTDYAALMISEYTAGDVKIGLDKIIGQEKTVVPWKKISDTFKTSANTAYVKFWLDTQISEDPYNGSVTWDDCVLDGAPLAYSVAGTVTSLGTALANTTVVVNGTSLTTDALGGYSIAGITGTATVRASKSGYYAQIKHRAPGAPGGTVTADFDLPLTNLLLNAGFDDGLLTGGWQFQSDGEAILRAESDAPNYYDSGEEAAVITGVTRAARGTVYQLASVKPNTEYTAACRFHPTTYADGALVVVEYTATMAPVATHRFDGVNLLFWQTLSTTFTTTPLTAIVSVGGSAYIYGTNGAIFDSFELNGPAGGGTIPDQSSLSGRVTSEGIGLAGAKVEIVGNSKYTTTTDADGVWKLDPPEGSTAYVIRASKADYNPQRLKRRAPNNADFDLTPRGNNLIINPGFEDGWVPVSSTPVLDGGWENPWGIIPGATEPETVAPLTIALGNEAVGIWWTGDQDATVYQYVSVLPNTSYDAGVMFTSAMQAPPTSWGIDPAQYGGLFVTEYDADGNWMGDAANTPVLSNYAPAWEPLTATFTTGPTTVALRVAGYAYMVDSGIYNRAVFDNFELRGPAGPKSTIVEAKKKSDGEKVHVLGKVVTAAYEGYYYIEEQDRSAGIKVQGTVPRSRNLVSVFGTIQTIDGERVVVSNLEQWSCDWVYYANVYHPAKPIALNQRAMVSGLSPVGLSVVSCGRAGSIDEVNNKFTIDDGSGLPLTVNYDPTTITLLPGDFVVVQGALGSFGTPSVPVLRAVVVTKVF